MKSEEYTPNQPTLQEIALQFLRTIERDGHYLPEITDTIRRAIEQPRPEPTLNEQALTALTNSSQLDGYRCITEEAADLILRALEQGKEGAK
jgi:hypothetical protein